MWLVWFRSSSCTYQTSQSTRKASKRLKKDRPAVSGETLEKVSILYHTARINDARIEAKEKEQAKQDNSHTYIDTTFGDDNLK